MSARCIAAGLALAAACTPESNVARDSAERVEIDLVDSPSARDREGDKVRYRTGAITVTLQRVRPLSPDRPSLREVAGALVQRYTLREVEGSLAERACDVATERARCVDGHIIDDGERIERRGFIVEDGLDFVLVEVIGRAAHEERIDAQLDRAMQTLRRVEG